MCGIAGFIGPECRIEIHEPLLRSMANSMDLRGPDAQGVWLDPASGVGLAHARLSIIDLSETGAQPMLSQDGSLAVAFNGEIYNHAEIRRRLEAENAVPLHGWRGSSDTETLLAAIQAWGLETALSRFIGMFAFALWDGNANELILVRDRLGIKPLYYGFAGRDLVFGSTLTPLKKHPGFSADISRDALALYLATLYIPCPHSIYEGVRKLPPGTYLRVTPRDAARGETGEPVTWWSVNQAARQGLEHPFDGDENEAAGELERLLTDSVRLRMIADVPLGAFLSGGVDSSCVVALMQSLSGEPVRTFTIGSDSGEYDEAAHARAVAGRLGTRHTELIGRPEQAMDMVPMIPRMCDEPFADSSIIPTYMVSKLARKHVTVSLSGDGGDELFAGYNRYLLAPRLWSALSWMPLPVRNALSHFIDPGLMRPATALVKLADAFVPSAKRQLLIADKTLKVVQAMRARDHADFHHRLASYWADPLEVVKGARHVRTRFTDKALHPHAPDYVRFMQAMDQQTYLPGDILTKVDRASMAVSLEARVPLLDHRVVEFSHSLPSAMNIAGGVGKRVLRNVLYRHVPKELMERPKQGFGLPIDEWLRGPLREWAEDLLNENRLARESFFNPKPVRAAWREHLSGRKNMPYHLWAVLMFQAWLAKEDA